MKKLICAIALFAALPSLPASANDDWNALRGALQHDLFAFEWRFNPADSPARLGRDLANFRGFSLHGTTGNLAFAAFGAVDDPQKPYSVKLAQVALAVGGAALAVYALDNGRDDPPAIQSGSGGATPAEGEEVGLSLAEVKALVADPNTPPELAAALQAVIGQTSHLPDGVGDAVGEIYDRGYPDRIRADGILRHGAYNGPIVTETTTGTTTTYRIYNPINDIPQGNCEGVPQPGQVTCTSFQAHPGQTDMLAVQVIERDGSGNPVFATESRPVTRYDCSNAIIVGTGANRQAEGCTKETVMVNVQTGSFSMITEMVPRHQTVSGRACDELGNCRNVLYKNDQLTTPVGDAVGYLEWACPSGGGACTGSGPTRLDLINNLGEGCALWSEECI